MPVEKLNLGQVIQKCLQVYLRHFLSIFLLGMLVFSPLIAISVAFPETMARGAGTLWDTIHTLIPISLGSILSAVLTTFVLEHLSGGRPAVADCLRSGFQRLPLLLALNFLLTIAYLAGIILLVIPGLISMALFSVAVPAFVAERISIKQSLRRSVQLARPDFWPVFALFLLFGVLVILTMVPFFLLVTFLSMENLVFANVGYSLWGVVMGSIQAVLSVVLYHELRTHREGITSEELLDTFA